MSEFNGDRAEADPGSDPEEVHGLEDVHGVRDATLGGYLDEHSRPPAFEGSDGHPYTVSIESEEVGDLRKPHSGFLVFPRWAMNGLGIVGHVETPVLWQGTETEIQEAAKALTLDRVKELLDRAIEERGDESEGWSG